MLLFTGYQLRDMRITGGGAPTAGPSPVVLSGGSPAAAGGAVPATSVPAAAGAAAAAASSATRRLVFDTPYGRDAVQKLGEWRSSLFARMAEFYKAEEAAQSQQGAVQVGRVEPQGVRRYNLFDAFIGCPAGQIQRLGPPGDGGKFVCVDGVLTHLQGAAKGAGDQERCAIYSIGSAGDFEFERSMLQVCRPRQRGVSSRWRPCPLLPAPPEPTSVGVLCRARPATSSPLTAPTTAPAWTPLGTSTTR